MDPPIYMYIHVMYYTHVSYDDWLQRTSEQDRWAEDLKTQFTEIEQFELAVE